MARSRSTLSRRFFGLSTAVALAATTVAAPSSIGAQTSARCMGMEADIVGTSGADVLRGTSADEVFVAFGGNDIIYGGGGDDVICGGSGDDRIFGESGNDVISAGRNADFVHGGSGNDSIFGNRGLDTLLGGKGDDILKGGYHADVLNGNIGNDLLHGGPGIDSIFGDDGNDSLLTTSLDEAVVGGAGTDFIDGTLDSADRLTETQFELAVADEVFRLVNCARTNSNTWCNPGDQDGLVQAAWNVTASERSGLRPLTRNAALDSASKGWSEYLVATNQLCHDVLGDHENYCGDGPLPAAAENVAYRSVTGPAGNAVSATNVTSDVATASAIAMMDQWMNSGGHRQAIMSSSYTSFGSGFEVAENNTFTGTQRFLR